MTWIDWSMAGLIVLLGVFQLVLLSGVIHGEDALAAPPSIDPSLLPEGNAPTGFAPWQLAQQDDSPSLPGRYVRPRGIMHTDDWPLDRRIPYCEEGEVSNFCYASKPPTSGLHLPVQQSVELDSGDVIRVPPAPGIYQFDLPREAVPHIQEHAGVFVGYDCETDACRSAVSELRSVVEQELARGAQVVMARFSDLDADTIALAAWTRVDSFRASDFDAERVRTFIRAHSCRYDPEGFCE